VKVKVFAGKMRVVLSVASCGFCDSCLRHDGTPVVRLDAGRFSFGECGQREAREAYRRERKAM